MDAILKPLSVPKLLIKTWEIIKKTWLNQIFIIFFILVLVSLCLLILSVLWVLLRSLNIFTLANFLTSHIIWWALYGIIFFVIAAIAQFLLTNYLLNPGLKLFDNVKSIKIYFKHFLCLTIIINLLLLLASLPLYVAVFLLLLKSYALGIFTLLFSLALIFFLATYLIFSPFILIDQKLTWLVAVKKSLALTEGHFWHIFLKILILCLILLGLNSLSDLAFAIPFAGIFFSALILLIMIILAFTYSLVLYQDFKNIKKV